MKQYLELVSKILTEGEQRGDRTGTGTRSIFGHQMVFDLQKGFPLLTTKKVFFRGVIEELLWMLRGETNIQSLSEKGIHIWDEWRRPYTLNRKIVEVESKAEGLPEAPYSGNFSWAGFETTKGSEDRMLCEIWLRMMRRCYDEDNHNYRFYGAKGITVAPRWHEPGNFIKDARKLPHWHYKQTEPECFQLDKDYFSSNQYGPGTCLWLRQDENLLYTSTAHNVRVTQANGWSKIYLTANEVCRVYGITSSSLCRFLKEGTPSVLKGNNRQFKGWNFEVVDSKVPLRLEIIEEGDLGPIYPAQWRRWGPTEIDQIAQVIEQIKTNPMSRRHIVTAWNPTEVEDMALPPCHMLFQFYVTTSGHLDCQLYQRSADVFLGVPFNIASYAALTHLIAGQTGLKPGRLVWTGGDCHIYNNHVGQMTMQLGREPRSLPTVKVHFPEEGEARFTLFDYDPHPPIKGSVSV